MGPELIKNHSFENLIGKFVADQKDKPLKGTVPDPGTMTLLEGWGGLQDWYIHGPIGVMTKETHRVWPNPILPPEGDNFLDLTDNGARPGGGISQFIDVSPGRYQISLALGMNDNTSPTSGPVAVNVGFFSVLSSVQTGAAIFHLDRGEIPYTDKGQWKVFTQVISVQYDPYEKADEQIIDFLARLHHQQPPVQHSTVIQIVAEVLKDERDKYNLPPCHFVGLDSVSVREMPPPAVSRHK
jgi:hypothetical protein